MSDYEGAGTEGWEAASLPGGPAPSFGADESLTYKITPFHSINSPCRLIKTLSSLSESRKTLLSARKLSETYCPLIQRIRTLPTTPGASRSNFNHATAVRVPENVAYVRCSQGELQQSARDIVLEYETYLISPGLDLGTLIGDYETNAIQEISEKYLCRVVHDTNGILLTSFLARSESVLLSIYQRLVILVKEMVSKTKTCLRANLLHLPTAMMYKDLVEMHLDPPARLYLPRLHGTPLPPAETPDWEKLQRRIHNRNRKIIRTAIDSILKGLHHPQKHVRIRVAFGEFGFRVFSKPDGGNDNPSFDTFCQIVKHPMTQLRQKALRFLEGDLFPVDEIGALPQFHEQSEAYAVQFDFSAAEANSPLRLDAHFKPSLNGKEIELTSERWLVFRANAEDEIAELNVFDFDKPNYQIHIGAVSLFDDRTAHKITSSFQHSLGFRSPPNGIKSLPRRRAIFPPGNKQLRTVSEILMTRFRFRETDGVFELRRKDVFDEGLGKASAVPSKSYWTAAYYYPEWDNLMGQFANLQPGERVGWHQSLETFFPDSSEKDDARALPKGFKEFMGEVEEIQDLLAFALARLAKL